MTNQQTGREAFEAWATSEFLDVASLNTRGDYRSDFAYAAWLGWQAALAQQGREVGEAVAWVCDRDGKTKLNEPFVATNPKYVKQHKDCNWHPLYLHAAAPKQQAVEVTDELCIALDDHLWEHHDISVGKEAIRAALLATLPGKTEVKP